jgi:hypothetical protein
LGKTGFRVSLPNPRKQLAAPPALPAFAANAEWASSGGGAERVFGTLLTAAFKIPHNPLTNLDSQMTLR